MSALLQHRRALIKPRADRNNEKREFGSRFSRLAKKDTKKAKRKQNFNIYKL